MIRAVCGFRAILKASNLRAGMQSLPPLAQNVRNSHIVSYRNVYDSPRFTKIGAEMVGAAMWWWVLYHLWHEPDHITGEFPYPSISSWTNSELGIPPIQK